MTDSPPTVIVTPVPALPRTGIEQRILDWSKQPSTQQGLSLLVGGLVLAWLHPFPSAEGIGATLLAASLPKLWPDNSTDAIKARDVANAIAHAEATRRIVDLEPAAAAVSDAIAQHQASTPAA